MVNSKAHTPKQRAGTSVAPVKAHVTINENIEKIKEASNDTSESNLSLNNRYVPMIKNTKRTPETTKRDVSLIKPIVNGMAVKRDRTGGTLN